MSGKIYNVDTSNLVDTTQPYKFSVALDAKFGKKTSEKLHVLAHKQIKFQTFELLDMIKYYQQLFDNLN